MDKLSPVGTTDVTVKPSNQPSLRDSQNILICLDFPAMNRWAIVNRPYGTSPRSNNSR